METISIFEMGIWFFPAFLGAVGLLAIFLRKKLERGNWPWIWGSLLCATWFGLVVLLAYVSSQGGAVRGTQARKILQDRDSKILDADQKIKELKAEVARLEGGAKTKDLLEENSRLRAEKTKAEAESEQLRSQVASLRERLKEVEQAKTVSPKPGVTPSPSPKVVRPPQSPVESPKYQEFPKFRVEIESIQVGPRGETTVFLAYVNKTQEDLKIGTVLAEQKTFLTDNAGNRYMFASSSGVSANHVVIWHGEPLLLFPGGRATAAFTFRASREMEKRGSLFSFTSEQAVVAQRVDRSLRTESVFNISIRNIEPR